jgi:hypothetical protein
MLPLTGAVAYAPHRYAYKITAFFGLLPSRSRWRARRRNQMFLPA